MEITDLQLEQVLTSKYAERIQIILTLHQENQKLREEIAALKKEQANVGPRDMVAPDAPQV